MISRDTRGEACHARIDGDLTIYAAAECRDALRDCFGGVTALEIDLSGVSEIDSAGVQLLIQAKREGSRRGVAVRLVNHSPAVQEIIDLYRLAPVFGDLMIISA